MGHLHRVPGGTDRAVTDAPPPATRLWGRGACWLALLGPFFFLSYGAATWVTSQRAHVGSLVFDWERNIPFLPWTIVPYWSIDVLYGLSLFLPMTARELDTHARRLLTAQIVAVSFFLLLPLTFTFPRPASDGVAGFLFDSLGKFDKPFNQAPSLHIALLVILWERYARLLLPRHPSARPGDLSRHRAATDPQVEPGDAGGRAGDETKGATDSTKAKPGHDGSKTVPHALSFWFLHAWFALIGISVLTTYQHHFLDIPTGALLGFFCLWLWPEHGPSPLTAARLTSDSARSRLAFYYTAGAALCAVPAFWSGGGALWLLWPAVALLLVAAHYAVFGAAGFQKAADGRMSLAARWLLAPYVAGAWINARLWTRHDPLTVPIAEGVSLGRFPSRATASRFATVIDLCAELPAAGGTAVRHALPMLDLIPPEPEQLRAAAALIETARASGPILVCCALGYGRSAAAVIAWLLATGRARDVEDAVATVRRARPKMVLREATRAAIVAAARA